MKSCITAELFFLDPDNGLMVPSAEKTRKSNKYIDLHEIQDYYDKGKSIIYYQHKARKKDDAYPSFVIEY